MNAMAHPSTRSRLARDAIVTAGATARAGLAWWTGELASLLPARLRRTPEASLVVEAVPDGLSVGRDTPHGWEALADFKDGAAGMWAGRADGAPAGAVLRLPAEMVLARTITLAAAAAENLHEVVGFQLDRYTPFDLEEVYLGCRVVGRDPDVESIDVALAVAPRADVDLLLDAARRRGIACASVVAACGAGIGAACGAGIGAACGAGIGAACGAGIGAACGAGIGAACGAGISAAGISETGVSGGVGVDTIAGADLELDLGTRQDAAPAARWRRLLWVAACVLLVLDLAVPLLRGHAQLAALRQELAAVRREAQAVASLRDEVEQASEQAAIPVQRWRQAPLSQLLAELTRLVPDTGWVTQMQIDQNTVQLTGYSASANALIPILEQSQLLANAAFRSPVTQDPVHGVEQFHLSVDLRKHGE